MGIIGGDLAAMEALAGRFLSTSDRFAATSGHLVARAQAAAERFGAEMAGLDRDARQLSTEIGQALARLRQQAAATTWTGANRARQDALLDALDDDIVRLRTAIDTFGDEAGTIVRGSLTPGLSAMQEQVATAGSSAQRVAASFATGVTAQRNAFDLVMNG